MLRVRDFLQTAQERLGVIMLHRGGIYQAIKLTRWKRLAHLLRGMPKGACSELRSFLGLSRSLQW